MSSPPERSWVLATPIGSSAQADAENAPAAAAAAVLLRSVLRLMFIAIHPPFAEMSSDQVFLQNRCTDGVFRIDHVAEPDTSGLAEQHVGVDLVEAVLGAHPAYQFAIGDARGIFERTGAADRHHKLFVLKPRPRKAPAL